MNIVKLGGSIINPDGCYNVEVINNFISIVKKSGKSFIFIVGGGKLCRHIQASSQPFLKEALNAEQDIAMANDEIGLAVTKINARYVLQQFRKKLGEQVFPEILLDPTQKPKTNCNIFFAGGWKPGHSTDTDMMLLAKAFKAEKVFKLSNFEIVKRIKPLKLLNLSDQEKKQKLAETPDAPSLTWSELHKLVGDDWVPGLNTPFDPLAAKLGLKMKETLTLFIGKETEFPQMLNHKPFKGTIVKG